MNVIRNPRADGEFITGLARGLSVLRTFSRETPDLSLSEIAAATNLNPAVVRRCLNTLVHLGYVGQRGRRFQLRPEVTVFASAFLDSTKLKEFVEPHLEGVRASTGDDTALATLSGNDIVYLVHVPGNGTLRFAAGIGRRLPARDTSLGRVLLAYMTEEYPAVRRSGHAVVRNELGSGLTTIAVPILRADGRIFAAIGCAATLTEPSKSVPIKTRLPALKAARSAIEADLLRYPMLGDCAA